MPKKEHYVKFFNMYLRASIEESFHGEARLDCPFIGCQKEKHFYANVDTGLWNCKRCDTMGNPRGLVTGLHQQALPGTGKQQWMFLQKFRKISWDIFQQAQWAYDEYHDRWLVPYWTYDPEQQDFTEHLNNLGVFYPSNPDDKTRFKIHKGLPHYLYNPGMHTYPNESGIAIICEGEWDTLAYYDRHRETEDLVLGKPGAGFNVNFMKTLSEVSTIELLLDNDEAGRKQTANAVRVIRKERPKCRIRVLDWSLIPDAPKDIRDLSIANPTECSEQIRNATIDYTDDISGNDEAPEGTTQEVLTAGYVRDATQFDEIRSFSTYMNKMDSMLHLNEDTRLSMAAILGITISYSIPGEPLWCFVIGPPSSGKTLFLESFGGENQWFDNLSKVTAESFVSGWRDETDDEPSYLPRLKNKTLFVKDFTVTLEGPEEAKRKVFGLLTDIYDGHVKIPFGNNQIREFHDTYFNMVAGVTDIIHSHSSASIGERFLRLDWLGNTYDSREYARRALLNFGQTTSMKHVLTKNTLGYCKYIRSLTIDQQIEPMYIEPIIDLAEFIATVRTKVEKDRYEGMKYKPRAELPARLAKQLAKLYVSTRTAVQSSELAFKVIRKAALDTCYGFSMDIVKAILENPKIRREEIAQATGIHAQRAWNVLRDLETTGVVISSSVTTGRKNGRPHKYFEINPKLLPALQPEKYLVEDRPSKKRQGPTNRVSGVRSETPKANRVPSKRRK